MFLWLHPKKEFSILDLIKFAVTKCSTPNSSSLGIQKQWKKQSLTSRITRNLNFSISPASAHYGQPTIPHLDCTLKTHTSVMLKMNYQHIAVSPSPVILIFISMFLGFCAAWGGSTPISPHPRPMKIGYIFMFYLPGSQCLVACLLELFISRDRTVFAFFPGYPVSDDLRWQFYGVQSRMFVLPLRVLFVGFRCNELIFFGSSLNRWEGSRRNCFSNYFDVCNFFFVQLMVCCIEGWCRDCQGTRSSKEG